MINIKSLFDAVTKQQPSGGGASQGGDLNKIIAQLSTGGLDDKKISENHARHNKRLGDDLAYRQGFLRFLSMLPKGNTGEMLTLADFNAMPEASRRVITRMYKDSKRGPERGFTGDDPALVADKGEVGPLEEPIGKRKKDYRSIDDLIINTIGKEAAGGDIAGITVDSLLDENSGFGVENEVRSKLNEYNEAKGIVDNYAKMQALGELPKGRIFTSRNGGVYLLADSGRTDEKSGMPLSDVLRYTVTKGKDGNDVAAFEPTDYTDIQFDHSLIPEGIGNAGSYLKSAIPAGLGFQSYDGAVTDNGLSLAPLVRNLSRQYRDTYGRVIPQVPDGISIEGYDADEALEGMKRSLSQLFVKRVRLAKPI